MSINARKVRQSDGKRSSPNRTGLLRKGARDEPVAQDGTGAIKNSRKSSGSARKPVWSAGEACGGLAEDARASTPQRLPRARTRAAGIVHTGARDIELAGSGVGEVEGE